MEDTRPNITVTADDWVDIYTLSSITVGTNVQITNRSPSEVVYQIGITKPDKDSQNGLVILPNKSHIINNASGIWMKSSSSFDVPVNVQDACKLASSSLVPNLTLAERASADGTLRTGYDRVNIAKNGKAYWSITMGSAPTQLALIERILGAFEDSGIKYYVYGGVTDINPTASPDIVRNPDDSGINWQRIEAPSDISSAIELDYTPMSVLGVGSSKAGGIVGFEGLRIQPNDTTFVLMAHNLSASAVEFFLRLQWIKTDDPNYFL